uniref:peroxidase-like n=1 Tax=Vespula vulgaris TaxID=7454 RepID=UPI002130FD9D|nr:peroxidase-like [Vespula vulgaris]XP_050848621.1 peroxidase-like [Vespula vulgaris]XP_050848622.1 peroxidase-like [Vespula vulgaris]XP_050848623.1 peroxidase-like [Vespula vulgaris]
MLGRKVLWLLWFLLVGRTFNLGNAAIDVNSPNDTTAKINRSRNSDQDKKNSLDLTSSESSYNSFYGYSFQNFFPASWMFNTFSTSPSVIPILPLPQRMTCGDTFNGQCQKSRYRSFDGTCNNLYNPTWGAANTRYGRLLLPNYADGIQTPTGSITGSELPLSRLVSFTLFPSVTIKDNKLTLAAMQWGQIITHDMALIAGTTQSNPHSTQCCTPDGHLLDTLSHDSKCYPIVIPYNDPVYSKSNIQCVNFVRSITDLDRGCKLRYSPAAEQLTVVTHYLDLSIVYGSNEQVANNLRAYIAGRMRVDIRSNREWPPAATNKSNTCNLSNADEVCYQAGDTRVNQNTQLTVLQILLLREHNRIAGILANLNPHWSDETIYQETRRIVIAEHQHISYYEWLPLFLGIRQTYDNKILYDTHDYVNDYDFRIDPSVLNEHSTAAFRYFHSLIAGYLQLINEERKSVPFPLRLSDYLNKPSIIEKNDNMDELTRGLSYQAQLASDQFFDEEITLYLFKGNKPLGEDLRAIDIQRNRDHGLASYNDFREYCNLGRAKEWNDFSDYISYDNIQKLASLYAHPDDVDLTVGGSLEEHVPGTLSGPTFLSILLEQFYRTRVGDRFWYESGDPDVAFTKEQLKEIRKASISKLLCNNGDNIQLMQRKGFEVVSDLNPLVKCTDLPDIDLSLWKDYGSEGKNIYHSIFDYYTNLKNEIKSIF